MAMYLGKSQWEYFVNVAGIWDMGVHRMVGIETLNGHPNAVSQCSLLTLPITLSLWRIRKEITHKWPRFWRRIFPYFLVFHSFLAVSSIILTNSRTGMVSVVLFTAILVWSKKGVSKKIGFAFLSLTLLLTLWIFIGEEHKNRLTSLWDSSAGPVSAQASAEGRLEGFLAGIEIFNENPVVGIGIGNFTRYRVRHVDGIPLSAHNLLAQVLAATGIIGTILFILFITASMLKMNKIRNIMVKDGDEISSVFRSLGAGFYQVYLLALFYGISGHSLLRYNWYWVAAFTYIAFYQLQMHIQKNTEATDGLT